MARISVTSAFASRTSFRPCNKTLIPYDPPTMNTKNG
eukprot:CAMPEP_0117635744 /NCGR_PEP_ID=MMETSP0802-20121206/6399_1 /TAXON_ID=38833 /ORGANISM="Micromonas sp., Strain CCMP2099" /LENGTH=36 /DNA_ID= /DNA_START= /DNA_END= /DNA_ORIENTATION=